MKKHILWPFTFLLLCIISDAGAQTYCDFFDVRVEAQSYYAGLDPDNGSFLFCPESAATESFRALATYLSDTVNFDPSLFEYTWTFRGESSHLSQASFLLEGPGAYPFTLRVEDPQYGCTHTLHLVAKVATIPHFDGTHSSVEEVCAKEVFTLRGVGNTKTWTGFPTSVMETAAIPENEGQWYESTLDFDVFESGGVIDSVEDIDRICLYVDHVNFGDLKFELECPDGASIVLKDFGEGGANLGEPVIWDNVTAGRGYGYCFTPFPQYGTMQQTTPAFHAYTDMAGNYYFNAEHLPAGTYTPDQSLQVLTGCPMNGVWKMRVTDNRQGENGFMHGWSLFFNESFYPDSLIFSPEIVRTQWYRENTPISGNPAQVSEQAEGAYTYRFEVEDNFGCRYDTTLTVTVLALPKAEILSELEMPVCEGDSTFLKVLPVEGSAFDWVYQWMLGNVDLPQRVFDTIMVKEPATFTIMITDTLTRCQNSFDFLFEDQNCELVIPNVFTPNADGINDVFEIENLEHYPLAHMVIFNRWGKRVFEHSDYFNNWWDGQGHPDGVYFYVLRYERLGKLRYAEGSVTIIR